MMASAGMVALPGWAKGWSPETLGNPDLPSFFPADEKAVLTAVADTFIPATGEDIGALDVEVQEFLERLFADCYETDVQQNIKTQFKALNTSARLTYGTDFAQSDQQQREALLLDMSRSDIPSQAEFFELLKRETIRGFLTSRKVLRDYYDYVVAPGHFYGCVDLNET